MTRSIPRAAPRPIRIRYRGSRELTARGRALRDAFRTVRRDVWSAREGRLVAKWEGYG